MNTNQLQPSISSPCVFNVTTQRRRSPLAALAAAPGAETAALAAFALLNTSCSSAVNTVNQNPLGPYGANGSCNHDCSYTQTWQWSADYRSVNSLLNQGIGAVNAGGAYNQTFQSSQAWVNGDLPSFNANLTGNITTIAQIDAAIIAAGGNETQEQALQLAAAFQTITAVLQNNLNEADQSLQVIATFLNQQNSNVGYLQTLATNEQTYIKQNATAIENDLIGKIACGSGDVQASFNTMLADVNAKFAAMQNPFNTANLSFQSALQAVSLVAGVFLSLQPKSALVSQYITQAQSYPPASPLRQMHLNMATDVWNSFVSEANTQFGGGS